MSLLIQPLIDKYSEEDFIRVYQNISEKKEDYDGDVKILDITKEMVREMKNKYGKAYYMDALYDNLSNYFADKYIKRESEKNKLFLDHYFKIIESKNVTKDKKLFCILDLLYENNISLKKAQELIYEIGLFGEKTPIEVDHDVTKLYKSWTNIDSNNF